jgi:hypothetical protein
MEVKLNLEQEQFRSLLEIVYLGNWMINSIRTPAIAEYAELSEMFFAAAKNFELDELARHLPKSDTWHASQAMHDSVEHFVSEYEDEVFWTELVDSLATRDLDRMLGEDTVDDLDDDEYDLKRRKFEKKYWDEFTENGVDNLFLKDLNKEE